jgi:hypothetical protein
MQTCRYDYRTIVTEAVGEWRLRTGRLWIKITKLQCHREQPVIFRAVALTRHWRGKTARESGGTAFMENINGGMNSQLGPRAQKAYLKRSHLHNIFVTWAIDLADFIMTSNIIIISRH